MFKSGYTLMLFKILENDVVDFLTYIPLEYYLGDKRKEIFSPRLAEISTRIGNQVDTFFRNWDIVHSKNIGVDVDDLTFVNFKSIEKTYKLSDEKVKILSTGEIITPFKYWNKWEKEDKNWWNAYNHVKHNGFYYKEEGNLNNVIESLSALFLLNCLHEESKTKLGEYGYRKFDRIMYDALWSSYITSQLFET